MAAFSLDGKRIYVAGHRGMVGGALCRRLTGTGAEILTATRAELNLTRQADVEAWMAEPKPDAVIVAAAKVGGIHANNERPADFIYENLMIEANLIHAAHGQNVEKLLFLGSSCIYPKLAPQPMTEVVLLTGPLEPTNEWYAIAKIAGIKLCQAYMRQHGRRFISAMPTNLYGPGDNFDLETSHVLPALMVKIDEARKSGADSVEIWGSGKPMREFLHVEDLADGLIYLLEHYEGEQHVNIGTGTDVTIAELAETIADVVGYKGAFHYNADKPDGTPRKLLDVSMLKNLGWQAKTDLKSGIESTYHWYQAQGADEIRKVSL